MTRQRPPRRRSRDGADDSYQLDAIVALFAMVLVILVTTAAASGIGTTLFTYRSVDAPQAAIQPASLAAPFPRLETWILRRGELLRLDYDAAAALLAEAGPRVPIGATDPVSGIDLSFLPSEAEIGAFDRFEVLLPADPLPAAGGVIAQIVPPTDAAALGIWATGDRPARVAVFASGVVHLPAVTAAAEAEGRPVSVQFLTGNVKFSERKTSATFSFRGVLRAY